MPGDFGLYVILTDPAAGYERAAQASVQKGVRFLQLRMKKASRSRMLQTAAVLREITRGTRTLFIINDRPDIAAEVDADGVHLGQDDMPLKIARRTWPIPGKLFGLSTHNEEQAAAAADEAPDYIAVGPVFATPAKEKPDPPIGLERMGRIIRSSGIPCVAIGGINASNLRSVLSAGARNFAVVRAVCASADPARAIDEIMNVWKQAEGDPASRGAGA
jgi:thiamine-phosphate pyrophosphorylase